MASTQIQTLLQKPEASASEGHTAALLNASFTSLSDLSGGSALDDALEAARTKADGYGSQVRLTVEYAPSVSSQPSGSLA